MEVLKLYIHVNGCEKVESECATVQMISFDGRCDGDYFRGEILPGGVDTQIYYKDQPSKLSARYLVQGIDHTGRGCRIFIENNGIMYDYQTGHLYGQYCTEMDGNGIYVWNPYGCGRTAGNHDLYG